MPLGRRVGLATSPSPDDAGVDETGVALTSTGLDDASLLYFLSSLFFLSSFFFDEEEDELRELLERRTLTCAVVSGITMPSMSVSMIRRRICFID